jgi:hypothetical protein
MDASHDLRFEYRRRSDGSHGSHVWMDREEPNPSLSSRSRVGYLCSWQANRHNSRNPPASNEKKKTKPSCSVQRAFQVKPLEICDVDAGLYAGDIPHTQSLTASFGGRFDSKGVHTNGSLKQFVSIYLNFKFIFPAVVLPLSLPLPLSWCPDFQAFESFRISTSKARRRSALRHPLIPLNACEILH